MESFLSPSLILSLIFVAVGIIKARPTIAKDGERVFMPYESSARLGSMGMFRQVPMAITPASGRGAVGSWGQTPPENTAPRAWRRPAAAGESGSPRVRIPCCRPGSPPGT